MKKLNRKGFTLVELLAVIIILAIVVGITIPAVLTTTDKAKLKAFQTAADTAADWFDRQYQVALTGLNDAEIATLDTHFTDLCGSNSTNCTKVVEEVKNEDGTVATPASKGVETSSKEIMAAAGLKATNIDKMKVYINISTGRTCVTLTAKQGGDYYNVTDGNTIQSSNCN